MFIDPAGSQKVYSTPQGDAVVNIIVEIFKAYGGVSDYIAIKKPVVTPLGETVGEIISGIFILIDAAQISENFAYLVAGIIINGQETIRNALSWYFNLAKDFMNFMITPLYSKILSFDANIFKNFYTNAVIGIKNIELIISESIKLSVSYKDGSKSASDFALSFIQQISYLLFGGFAITYTEKSLFITSITNIIKKFDNLTVELIEVFEGAVSPLFISLEQSFDFDIDLRNPDPTAFAVVATIPIMIMIKIITALTSPGSVYI